MGFLNTCVCSAVCALVLMTSAHAEDIGQKSAASSAIVLHKDAPLEAQDWSLKHPGIAVGVILGTQSKFSPQQVEAGLRRSLREAGVSDVTFFFEQNDMPSTGVVFCYSGATDGPFLLGKSQPEAKKSAKQYLFQQSHPTLRYEYPD